MCSTGFRKINGLTGMNALNRRREETLMIYTITPNPALDLGGVVDRLVPNEKSYVQDETRFPGGNAINAARIIKKLGQPVIASGFLGGGTGDEIEKLLRN